MTPEPKKPRVDAAAQEGGAGGAEAMDQDANAAAGGAPAAAPPQQPQQQAVAALTDAQRLKQLSSELAALPMREQMRLYYERLFPFAQMHRWLAYGNEASSTHPAADRAFFQRRELCFTLDGDIFARYQSFPDAQAWSRACRQRVPTKIDVGPVYSYDPRDRAKYGRDFRPMERELVFDVDLTDYDDVRTCGSGGHICGRCWPFMACAVEAMDALLKQDFGFKHVLWVYSGRRGVHGWVCDAGARGLADEVRAALVGFCSVYRGTEAGGAEGGAAGTADGSAPPVAKVRLATGATRHPSVERAYVALRRAWETRVLPAQGLLDGPETWGRVLQYVPDEEVRQALAKAWSAGRLLHGGNGGGNGNGGNGNNNNASSCLSVARWHDLVAEVERAAARAARGAAAAAGQQGQQQQGQQQQGPRARAAALTRAVPDVVLAFTYPRLDVEVSKKMNHLLKAPFCVHPKTGRVCVPLDAARVWEFDPEATEAPAAAARGGSGGGKKSGAGGGSSKDAGAGAGGDYAPRVTDLLAQAALAQQQGRTGGAPGQLWRETGLAPSLRFFEEGFLAPLSAEARAALTAKAAAAAAEVGGSGAAAAAGLAW